MKIFKGDTVIFNCPYAEKIGEVIKIEKDDYHIQTEISIWIVKFDKIIKKIEE